MPVASAQTPVTKRADAPADFGLRAEALGEVLGTCVLLLLGFGVGCSAQLAPISLAHVAGAWGGAVVLASGVASKLSDSHLNPAVTLAMVLHRAFPPRKAVVYVLAQLLGALLASLLAGLAFLPQLRASGGWLPFQLAFSAAPGPVASAASAAAAASFSLRALVTFAHEAWATCVLVFLVMHLEESPLKPAMIGGAVALLISVAAPLTGAGLNPARDVGPRLAAVLLRMTLAPQLAGAGVAQAAPYVTGSLVGGALGGALASWVEHVRTRAAGMRAHACALDSDGSEPQGLEGAETNVLHSPPDGASS